MSKRPCALCLTSDESHVLCGDKFGDVYSLPLLGINYEATSKSEEIKKEPVPFMPAASSRTVHTKRNQEALRNQQRQTNQRKEQKALKFEHQLLLGHVSLLTDLICVRLDGNNSLHGPGKPREYIVTSDRDEHIRISRGMPQAHIIEGYCQGHAEFISRICVPRRLPHILISGGGDHDLFIWDWLRGVILQRIDLKEPINALKEAYRRDSYPAEKLRNPEVLDIDDSEEPNAVSGIWSLFGSHVVVACEG